MTKNRGCLTGSWIFFENHDHISERVISFWRLLSLSLSLYIFSDYQFATSHGAFTLDVKSILNENLGRIQC